MQEIEFTPGKMKCEECPNNAVTYLQNEDHEQCKWPQCGWEGSDFFHVAYFCHWHAIETAVTSRLIAATL